MRVRRGGSGGRRPPSAATSSWPRTAGDLGERSGPPVHPLDQRRASLCSLAPSCSSLVRAASSKVLEDARRTVCEVGKKRYFLSLIAFELYTYPKQLTAPPHLFFFFLNELPMFVLV